jgi:hypothetical protein
MPSVEQIDLVVQQAAYLGGVVVRSPARHGQGRRAGCRADDTQDPALAASHSLASLCCSGSTHPFFTKVHKLQEEAAGAEQSNARVRARAVLCDADIPERLNDATPEGLIAVTMRTYLRARPHGTW